MLNNRLRWCIVIGVILAITGLFLTGLNRIKFETDILTSLPQNDPVLADARFFFAHHLINDRMVVDVGNPDGDRDKLVEMANLVEAAMRESGLYKEVGFANISQLIPGLINHIVDHLPLLFNEQELEESVKPLLVPAKISQFLKDDIAALYNLDGIGQTALIASDPLALRNLVLSRLAFLLPIKGTQTYYKGHLVSADGKHILIVAEPLGSGMDQKFAQQATALMEKLSQKMPDASGGQNGFTLTPVGAYRAALDNETNAKRNVQRAVKVSTFAIALLLIVGFPRPLIGVLALIPAFAGTMLALFVYSLFHPSISMLAVGFGGAIISFTVDYGITYLLFLDRSHETRGLEVTKEVWSLGLLAMLTTAVSFAFLIFSDFPALMEIGQFAALGVVFTYIFVHGFFPLLFPVVPPTKRPPYLPLQQFVNKIISTKGIWKTYAALAFGVCMLFFAKPEININLEAMNTVSHETQMADKLFKDVWGDISSKVYLMVDGRNGQDIQQKSDRLAAMLAQEVQAGRLSQTFVPSMIFPGDEVARKNFSAWRNFWNSTRVVDLTQNIAEVSRDLGFTPDAFSPFIEQVNRREMRAMEIPERFAGLLGISIDKDRLSWTQISTLTPGPSYDGEAFFKRFSTDNLGRVFDPALFGKRLGSTLLSAFTKMGIMVGIVTTLTAYLYFFDWRLTLIGMAPTLFALICTLGTLNLMGQPLGIPTIMIFVVIIGMGTDYALYLIRAYQCFLDEENSSLGLIRLSVFFSFATTSVGMGALALSDNAMLKSVGLALTLGIGYSFLGAVMIVPPLLKRIFTVNKELHLNK